MIYLTNQDNTDWKGTLWGENITHTEENPNYQFMAYKSLDVAAYMYPCYEGIKEPKFWECTGEGETPYEILRGRFKKLTTLKEVHLMEFETFNAETNELKINKFPTNEQRITFGILCSLNLVLNPIFREWAVKYLNGTDPTKQSAQDCSEKLSESVLDEKTPPEHQYITCALAALGSVMLDDPALFAANAAHRAFHDSLELTEPLNLEQTAMIVNMMPRSEIVQIL